MADERGTKVEAAAASILVQALEDEVRDRAESVDGSRRGLADFAGGRFRSFGAFAEEQRRKHRLDRQG